MKTNKNNEEVADTFVEADNYTGNPDQKISFKQIVLQQLSRVTIKMTTEWRGGYYEERASGAEVWRVYVPDSRDEFVNGVKCLYDLLYSYFDADFNKEDASFNKKKDELWAEYKKSNDEAENNNKDYLKQQYKQDKAERYRELFRALNSLLHRLHYLEGKNYDEEVG